MKIQSRGSTCDYVVNKSLHAPRVFKVAPRGTREARAKGQSNWSRERQGRSPTYILQTYSPLEIYCKSRRAGIWIRAAPPLSINRMDFGNSLHSPDVCVCWLRFFCSCEKTSPRPPHPHRFRFYLSKVFHSVVIVWVASSIVAKANIYLGFSLLSICAPAPPATSMDGGRRAHF